MFAGFGEGEQRAVRGRLDGRDAVCDVPLRPRGEDVRLLKQGLSADWGDAEEADDSGKRAERNCS